MPIDLTEFERGKPFTGDYLLSLGSLQARLARAQFAQLEAKGRMLVVFEGHEGAGKADVLKLLSSSFDPRLVRTVMLPPGKGSDEDGHWLQRFWLSLPGAGRSSLYFHSWYSRVLEEKVLGLVDDKGWHRAFDEINEFEAQQRDQGTLIVKLYFHVTEPVRRQRLEARKDEPLGRLLGGVPELRDPEARAAYDEALRQTLDQTDTRWAPWSVIDANDSASARIAALTAVARAMDKAFAPVKEGSEAEVVPLHGESDGQQG